MLRILHVIGAMGSGGAEALLMNIYRQIDRTKIQFDFVVHTNKEAFYDNEIISLGGKIYRAPRFNVVNFIQYRKFWNAFFQEHPEYPIVHGHINSSAAIYLQCAKKHGRVAVVHSHATKNQEKSLRAFVFLVASYPIRYIADFFFGCSKQAGIDRFGKKVAESDRFRVLNNGIDTSRYVFDLAKRNTIRSQYGIPEGCLTVGHVGRFTFAKNHKFLIDVFAQIHEKEPNSVLMMIGVGELEEEIRQQIRNLKIEKSVIFVGQTNAVCDYLQAMDVFVFPSVFEGLGIALVEAEAAGLPCVVSENIQKEADIGCGLVKIVSLNAGVDQWVKTVLENRNITREDCSSFVKDSGFDISGTSDFIQHFYFGLLTEK